MFSSATGTFLQRDPMGYSNGGVLEYSHSAITKLRINRKRFVDVVGANLYEYCKSSPLKFVDPFGLAEGLWNQFSEATSGVWNLGLFDAWDAAADPKLWGHTTAGDARANANRLGKNERQVNALRHCIWQALLTFQNGATTAEQVGNAHEWGVKDVADSNTDQFNNVIGRRIGGDIANKLGYDANKAWFNCSNNQYTKAVEMATAMCLASMNSGELISTANDPRLKGVLPNPQPGSDSSDSGGSPPQNPNQEPPLRKPSSSP